MKFLVLIAIVFPLSLKAQSISVKGIVSGDEGPIPYVNVGVKGRSEGTATDMEGRFNLTLKASGSFTLIFSSIGYKTTERKISLESLPVPEIKVKLLPEAAKLEEVVVTGTLKESYISESPVKVEVITRKVLTVTPLASVIEAVNMVNGVQEQLACGVCGTNDIHINGMEGPYTLVLIDGMPIISALGSVYGFNGIPISLVERIEVIKGPSSTLYGSEAVGGVINIITRKPQDMPVAGFSSWLSSHLETSADFHLTGKAGKAKTLLSSNIFYNQHRLDLNDDGFTDFPLNQRISLFNKWEMGNTMKGSSIAGRIYTEDRFGGVMNWENQDRGSSMVYGESIRTRRAEVFGNVRRRLGKAGIRYEMSANYHDQDSWYGDTPFQAEQAIVYGGIILNTFAGRHDITAGLSGRFQYYRDNTPASVNDRRVVPGVFIQDEIAVSESVKFMPGLRADYHTDHGAILSPRFSLKYDRGYTTYRLNSGTGFRQVNLFTEYHAALTGSREVFIAEALEPERSYNVNLNLHHVTQGGKWSGSIDADLFYTVFTNKIIPDYDTDPNLIIYRNLSGSGITRGVALSFSQEFSFPLRLNAGATLQDVFEVVESNGEALKEYQKLVPVLTGTWLVGYHLRKWKLKIDYTGRIFGPQHLPEFPGRPETSPWFSLQHFQVSRKIKSFEVFSGVKNIFNFTQPSPLIHPEDPFGDNFDTSYIWGPLQSRRFFIGLRWTAGKST